jgi:hypothetical protein
VYCSRLVRGSDWKKYTSKSASFLTWVMEIGRCNHSILAEKLMAQFEGDTHNLPEGVKRFFKLFQESTSSVEAGRRKEEEAMPNERTRRTVEVSVISQFVPFLGRLLQLGDAFVSNSPLLVMLQFVDPNVLFGDGENMLPAPPLGRSSRSQRIPIYVNQLIPAKNAC